MVRDNDKDTGSDSFRKGEQVEEPIFSFTFGEVVRNLCINCQVFSWEFIL